MISVLPVKNTKLAEKLYSENKIKMTENSRVITASESEKILGCCFFELDNEKIIITEITVKDDLMLTDGILRAALHIADYNGILKAYCYNKTLLSLLKKIDFVKSDSENSLKIEKLHQISCNCKKNNK